MTISKTMADMAVDIKVMAAAIKVMAKIIVMDMAEIATIITTIIKIPRPVLCPGRGPLYE